MNREEKQKLLDALNEVSIDRIDADITQLEIWLENFAKELKRPNNELLNLAVNRINQAKLIISWIDLQFDITETTYAELDDAGVEESIDSIIECIEENT